MSSFHDQLFAEIDAARKLAAEFANRHGRKAAELPQETGVGDRLALEEAATSEIAALAAEEERLADQARERAASRAKARAAEQAKVAEVGKTATTPTTAAGWNAMAILNGLAKLRAKERSAAEDLIRKAHEVHSEEKPAAPVRAMWTPSHGASHIWYFTSGDTRCGPVTFAELRTMAESRVLDPRIDMVWKEGMDGWKQAGLLDGLFERRSVPAETAGGRGGRKPKLIAALPTDLTKALASKQMHWPGTDRVTLWLGLLLFPLLWGQLLWWGARPLTASFGSAAVAEALRFATLVPAVVAVYLILGRLVNVGMSRWWSLVFAIPLLNLWVAFRCLICPAGYAHHRKLDRTGFVLIIAVLGLTPLAWYFYFHDPDLLSPAHVHAAVYRWIRGLF